MGSRCWHACLSHEREGVPSSPLRLMPLRSQIQAPCFPASPDGEWSSMHRSYRLAWWGLRSHRSWCTNIQVIPASIQRTLLPALVFVETVDIVVLSIVSPPGRSTWARKPRRWDTRDVPFSVACACSNLIKGCCMCSVEGKESRIFLPGQSSALPAFPPLLFAQSPASHEVTPGDTQLGLTRGIGLGVIHLLSVQPDLL